MKWENEEMEKADYLIIIFHPTKYLKLISNKIFLNQNYLILGHIPYKISE